MNKFLFDGIMSSDYGIYISGSGTFNSPERDVESVDIPGRNGTLVIDNKRFKNVTVSYPAFIRQKFKENTDAARLWLCKKYGYCRLEDSYHPEYYMLARFVGPLDFDSRFLNKSGECTISFDCKPQRFLKTGEYKILFLQENTLFNPTGLPARPFIRVYGSGNGSITIGNTMIIINDIDEYIDLDSETENAFKETKNCNYAVTGTFPVLGEGSTGITFSGGVTKIEIIPRWWTV